MTIYIDEDFDKDSEEADSKSILSIIAKAAAQGQPGFGTFESELSAEDINQTEYNQEKPNE